MPGRKAKPPRLWCRPDDGQWIILDRGRQVRTGCGENDVEGAAGALETYLSTRHRSTVGERNPAAILISDVLVFYGSAQEPKGARALQYEAARRYEELCVRLETLTDWWGAKTLADITKSSCQSYTEWRVSQPRRHAKTAIAKAKPIRDTTPRRELEDLRAAVRDYHAEFIMTAVPVVTLPERPEGRHRYLTRQEAARVLGAALGFVWQGNGWRDPEGKLVRRDRVTRTRRRHAARFIIIGLYSSRREATIRRTSWTPAIDGPWLDLEKWIYHGKGAQERGTKKRRPPAKIATRLRPHLARWRRMDLALAQQLRDAGVPDDVRYVIHMADGRPLAGKIKTGWAGILEDAGLAGEDIVRHTLRHTAATWLMQSGADLATAASWLGMTVAQLEENYWHHHPDFQEDAAAAFSGRRR